MDSLGIVLSCVFNKVSSERKGTSQLLFVMIRTHSCLLDNYVYVLSWVSQWRTLEYSIG